MKNSIKEELVNYLMELTYKRVLNDGNRRDWYYYAFQEEDYIKDPSQADKWLKRHDLNPLEAVYEVQKFEIEKYGQYTATFSDSACLVNYLVEFYGESLLKEVSAFTNEQLYNKLQDMLCYEA
jgi:hypothetical protein